MHGCCGHMGQVISQIVKEDADAQIVAGIDPFDNGKMEYPVYKSLEDCKEKADVVIDFASAKAEDTLLDYCGAHKLPVVVCTTGLSEEQLQKVAETAKKTAFIQPAIFADYPLFWDFTSCSIVLILFPCSCCLYAL